MGVQKGNLLHVDPDARVAALELRDEILHHLPFPAEGPEAEGDHPGVPGLAGNEGGSERGRHQPVAAAQGAVASSSQPPVKPARFRPRTM